MPPQPNSILVNESLLADPVALGVMVQQRRIPFDAALAQAWHLRTLWPGVFRSSTALMRRTRSIRRDGAPGQFWLQHNPGRNLRRAPCHRFDHVICPFDAQAFHFASNRIRREEVLLQLTIGHVAVQILLNPSPFGFAHSLIVIDPEARHPQVLDEAGLRVASALVGMSARSDIKIGFNSLGACASVNHYHLQLIYFRQADVDDDFMPSERSVYAPLPNCPGLSTLVDYPARAFHIPSYANGSGLPATAALIEVLQQLNIPHNVLVGRSGTVVVPRASQYAIQSELCSGLAFLELNGEMLLPTDPAVPGQVHQEMSDEDVADLIGKVGIGSEAWGELTSDVARHPVWRAGFMS